MYTPPIWVVLIFSHEKGLASSGFEKKKRCFDHRIVNMAVIRCLIMVVCVCVLEKSYLHSFEESFEVFMQYIYNNNG